MKNKIAFFIAVFFIAACLTPTLSAGSVSPSAFYQTESTVVLDGGVQKNIYQNSLGQTMIQYPNLDAYIDKELAKSTDPNDSMKIAEEIIKEVRGNDMLSVLPEEYILEALTYKEVFQTVSYIKTNENGTTQYISKDAVMQEIAEMKQHTVSTLSELPSDFVNDRTSSDGYMRLVTTAVRVEDPPTCYDDRNHYYLISVYSEWLIRPTYTYEDVLALAYGTAIYDDAYGVYAYLSQSGTCTVCGKTTSEYYEEIYRNDTPDYNNPEAEDYLSIDFPGGSGVSCYVNFTQYTGVCAHDGPINHSPTDQMVSYLQTRVYSQSWDFEVRSGYSHKWTGIGSISVSFSTGGVSIGFSCVSFTTDYFGTPLTVTYLSSINPAFPSPFSKTKEYI